MEAKKSLKKKVPTKGRAQAPRSKKKPFRLEVGKHYITRDGESILKITKSESLDSKYPYYGTVVEGPENGVYPGDTYTESGGYCNSLPNDEWDLVKRVPSPKGVKR
jgi:hypothetical protein